MDLLVTNKCCSRPNQIAGRHREHAKHEYPVAPSRTCEAGRRQPDADEADRERAGIERDGAATDVQVALQEWQHGAEPVKPESKASQGREQEPGDRRT